jgi:hypothetical protein
MRARMIAGHQAKTLRMVDVGYARVLAMFDDNASARATSYFRAAASAVLRKTVFLDMNSAVLDV